MKFNLSQMILSSRRDEIRIDCINIRKMLIAHIQSELCCEHRISLCTTCQSFITQRGKRQKSKLSIVNYQLSIIIILLFLGTSTMMAQTDRDFVRKGNREYRAKNYSKAEINYRKALEKNAQNPQAAYNLGNALLLQGKDSLAVVQYNNALKICEGRESRESRESIESREGATLSKIYHNIGVVCQASKDFDQAIEAYKASLRLNPSDDETRYNLVLCQKQQKKNKNDKDKNKNNKDKNKNDKDKNKNDKNKNKNDKDKDKNKDNQPPKPNDKPEQQKGEMSKETAEQLLNAALQQEKSTKEKMKQVGGTKRKLKKNW